MAPARLDPHWRYRELRAIALENARLRLTVLPELGAKLYDLVYKPADRNLLWHNRDSQMERPAGIGSGGPASKRATDGQQRLRSNRRGTMKRIVAGLVVLGLVVALLVTPTPAFARG